MKGVIFGVFRHRIAAIVAALLATCALVLLIVAGTICSFLTVSTKDGQPLETESSIENAPSSVNLGILCDGAHFYRDGDTFWDLSRIFWFASVGLGSLNTILSWLLSTVLGPNEAYWKALSIGSASTAVLQVPIFLVFESEPCTDFQNHECQVSIGVVMLITSTVFWVLLTLFTQCTDPPRWAAELNAWKVQKRREGLNLQQSDGEDDGMEEMLIIQRYSSQRPKASPRLIEAARHWLNWRRWAFSADLPIAATESIRLEDGFKYLEVGSYYANSNNSRLVLKVTPDGKRIGDDQRSVTTFGDLEDFAHLTRDSTTSPMVVNPVIRESDIESDAKLIGEELVQSDCDGTAGVPATLLQQLPPESKDDAVHPDTNRNSYSDEPLVFSDAAALARSNISAEDGNANGADGVFLLDATNEQSRAKIVSGIRALTVRMKRDVSRKVKGKIYNAMDSDSYQSKSTLSIDGNGFESFVGGDVQQRNNKTSTLASDRRENDEVQLIEEWNDLFSQTNNEAVRSYALHASSEDDPELVLYSSEESETSVSMLSFDARQANEEDSSSLSSATMSDSSDSDDPVDVTRANRLRRGRPRRRRYRRSFSAGNSIASRTSLLDTTIDEETDYDLKEFESSDDESDVKASVSSTRSCNVITPSPQPLTRTKSAPHFGINHSALSSLWMHGTDSYSLAGYENRELRKHQIQEQSDGSYVVNTDETTASGGDTSCNIIHLEGYSPSTDEDDDCSSPRLRDRRRSRSLSARQRRRSSCMQERVYTDGIHSALIGDSVFDDSSEDNSNSGENRSTHSTLSRHARRARVRRMQLETVESHTRRRARTLDPPKNRWQSSCDDVEEHTECIITLSNPDAPDYGTDEASL